MVIKYNNTQDPHRLEVMWQSDDAHLILPTPLTDDITALFVT